MKHWRRLHPLWQDGELFPDAHGRIYVPKSRVVAQGHGDGLLVRCRDKSSPVCCVFVTFSSCGSTVVYLLSQIQSCFPGSTCQSDIWPGRSPCSANVTKWFRQFMHISIWRDNSRMFTKNLQRRVCELFTVFTSACVKGTPKQSGRCQTATKDICC